MPGNKNVYTRPDNQQDKKKIKPYYTPGPSSTHGRLKCSLKVWHDIFSMDPGSEYSLVMHDEVAVMTTNSQGHVHQHRDANVYRFH